MDMMKLMKKAAGMQREVERVQQEMATRRVEFSRGGGMVKATASGDGSIAAISIDPKVINPADKEMLEDLVLSAVDGAIKKAREMSAAEMQKVTAGLGLPGMPGLH